MTLLVRNAEHLLAKNIEFHRRQGVDFFVITDNASIDRTPEIAQSYVDRGLAHLIHEPRDDYSQAMWVTRMARLAATDFAADWVINNDDDEFWYHPVRDLKAVLAMVPADRAALRVERSNHVPLVGVGADDFERVMLYRERDPVNEFGAPLPGKTCHRAFADIEVAQGNARVFRAGAPLALARLDGVRIAHFPLRDYAAYERKIRFGGAAYARNTELPETMGKRWRSLHALWQAGGLREWYERRLLAPAQVETLLADGALIRDETVAHVLRQIIEDETSASYA